MPQVDVNVVVVTYRRPDQLRSALESLRVSAERSTLTVGTTVVDDDAAGSARAVAADFDAAFAGGCHYVVSGARNISTARNRGYEAALGSAEWIGSIDDDVTVPPDWFEVCRAAVASGEYSAVTGSLLKDFSLGPAWLTREPFDQIGITRAEDASPIDVCATGNNWVRETFLAEHADVRFDPAFGRTGGEDVEFFTRARTSGLSIVFCQAASVSEPQPADRCTLRYQIRRAFWLGVLESRTHRETSRLRIAARAVKRTLLLGAAQLSPADRRRRGWRYCSAVVASALGSFYGLLGGRLGHK